MAIAKLSIDLEARLADLQAGLDKAGLFAQQTADRISKSFSGITSLAGGLGVGLLSGFSVAGFTQFFKATVDGIDRLNDLKAATGSTIENISALEDIAARTGTTFDDAGGAVLKFNRILNDAQANPEGDAAQRLKQLGLNLEELLRLDPVEALQKMAIAIRGFADGAEKGRLMGELFGKQTKATAKFMEDLADAGQLVGTVTTREAEEANRFNNELAAMNKNLADVTRSLAGPMVSALNETIDKFREGAKEGKSFYRVIFEEQLKMIGLGSMVPSSGGATGSWEDATPKPQLPKLVTKRDLDAAKRAADERIRLAEFAARQLVDIEEQAAQDTADAWKTWEKQQIADSKERADAEMEQWRQVFEFIDQEQERAIEEGQVVLQNSKKFVDEWSVFADQAARNIQDSLGDTLMAVMDGNFRSIGDSWKHMLDRMVAEALAAKLGKALLGDFGSTGQIGGWAGDLFNWAGSFFGGARAGGGPVSAGMTYLVGERGPELLHMGAGSGGGSITPNGRAMGGVTIHQHITAPAGMDRASRLQLMADVGLATQRALARNT